MEQFKEKAFVEIIRSINIVVMLTTLINLMLIIWKPTPSLLLTIITQYIIICLLLGLETIISNERQYIKKFLPYIRKQIEENETDFDKLFAVWLEFKKLAMDNKSYKLSCTKELVDIHEELMSKLLFLKKIEK